LPKVVPRFWKRHFQAAGLEAREGKRAMLAQAWAKVLTQAGIAETPVPRESPASLPEAAHFLAASFAVKWRQAVPRQGWASAAPC
jgi:hypothetical protein